MARKDNTPKPSYGELLRDLKSRGAGGAYLLWGEETYLRESFFSEIKKICFPDGEDDFSYHRLEFRKDDFSPVRDAVETIPFMCPNSLVEVRGGDINLSESAGKELADIIADVPEYCTLVFIPDDGFKPNGTIGLIKKFKKTGNVLEFAAGDGSTLLNWIARRFSALGKTIGRREAEYLVFQCGSLMNGLIPEIEKVAAYSQTEIITKEDIDAAAVPVPEAEVFKMLDAMAAGNRNEAMRQLGVLLNDRGEEPIGIISLMGTQYRRMYAARICREKRAGESAISELTGITYPSLARKTADTASRFSRKSLEKAVLLCAEYDCLIKSTSTDDKELTKELAARLAMLR